MTKQSLSEAQQIIEKLLEEDAAAVKKLEAEIAKLETKLRMKRNQVKTKRKEMRTYSLRFDVPLPK